MQRGWRSVVVALAATALLASGALAQRRGGGFGMRGGGGGMQILRMDAVQTELKMTADQASKVDALSQRLREERRGQFQDLRDLSPEQRQARMAEMRAKETKELGTILNADQMKRYRQLVLQRQGLTAVTDQEVATELNITADQQTKVREILAQQAAEQRSLFQGGGGGDREARREKMEALRKQTDEKIAAVLTAEQKSKWQAMLGTPFNFPQGPGPARAIS